MLQPLPIDGFLKPICQAVAKNSSVVLTATPGAGKTTRLPPELLSLFKGKILVLQPRRMAAVAAAHRVAEERGWRVGFEVGYQVRFDSKPGQRLNFVTDALALRSLITDPELNGVDLVIIDEFHERNLNQDIMLGALKELQQLGRGIKVLVMSATLDMSRLENFLAPAKVVDVPGKVFPLGIQFAKEGLRPQMDRDFYERLEKTIVELSSRTRGDILVFLPGQGEIHRLQEQLIPYKLHREVHALHGSLSLGEQRRVLGKSSERRVILSTNVAEASVTIDGVDTVIDCGLAKVMQINHKTGFSQLQLKRIAQFNAGQRAGRAARQKEGLCVRMWTEHEHLSLSEAPVPECQRVDLSSAVLLLAQLGVRDFTNFAWFDDPPPVLLKMAVDLLHEVTALDHENRLTLFGEKILRYPLPPRWGALLAFGEEHNAGHLAARMCAILAERDDFAVQHTTTQLECDLLLRLDLLRENARGTGTVQKVSEQLERLVRSGDRKMEGQNHKLVRELLLKTQSHFLCRRRGQSERAVMVGGRGVRLSPDSQVKNSEFFVALHGVDLPGQADSLISVACGMSKELVIEVLQDRIQSKTDIHFDEEKGQFFSRTQRYLEDLAIDEPSLTPVNANQVAESLATILLNKWDWFVAQHEGLKNWLQRWQFLARHNEKFRDLLNEQVRRQFIEMVAYNKTSIKNVLEQDLVGLLESQLDRAMVSEMHRLVPSYFIAPTGFRHAIEYGEQQAYVDVRLQELFGLADTPKVAGAPLTFRLLGPNYRPMQVTSDLAGFWRNSYFEVRKELRARYPKHSWPEDPLSAKPEAKGSRRP